MIVQMIFVKMGGNDNLILLSPHFLCQLQTDFMCLFGCDFAGFKTLITVPSDISVFLAVLLFR